MTYEEWSNEYNQVVRRQRELRNEVVGHFGIPPWEKDDCLQREVRSWFDPDLIEFRLGVFMIGIEGELSNGLLTVRELEIFLKVRKSFDRWRHHGEPFPSAFALELVPYDKYRGAGA